jgi:hypothetical protein
MTSECFFVRSDTRDTSSTSSALVMLPPFMVAPHQRPALGSTPSLVLRTDAHAPPGAHRFLK